MDIELGLIRLVRAAEEVTTAAAGNVTVAPTMVDKMKEIPEEVLELLAEKHHMPLWAVITIIVVATLLVIKVIVIISVCICVKCCCKNKGGKGKKGKGGGGMFGGIVDMGGGAGLLKGSKNENVQPDIESLDGNMEEDDGEEKEDPDGTTGRSQQV